MSCGAAALPAPSRHWRLSPSSCATSCVSTSHIRIGAAGDSLRDRGHGEHSSCIAVALQLHHVQHHLWPCCIRMLRMLLFTGDCIDVFSGALWHSERIAEFSRDVQGAELWNIEVPCHICHDVIQKTLCRVMLSEKLNFHSFNTCVLVVPWRYACIRPFDQRGCDKKNWEDWKDMKGSKDGGKFQEHPDWNLAEAYAAQLVTVAIAQFRLDKRHLQGLQELTELTQSWNGHPGIHQVRSQCAEPRPDPRPTSKSEKSVGIGPFRHVFTHFTAGLL